MGGGVGGVAGVLAQLQEPLVVAGLRHLFGYGVRVKVAVEAVAVWVVALVVGAGQGAVEAGGVAGVTDAFHLTCRMRCVRDEVRQTREEGWKIRHPNWVRFEISPQEMALFTKISKC